MFRLHALLLLVALAWSHAGATPQDKKMTPPEPVHWKSFSIEELAKKRAKSKRSYLEFLRVPTMRTGLYVLPAGSTDGQKPHAQDEVYYVLEGKARFEVDGSDVAVGEGSVLFVKAGVDHRFHDIEKELKLLVFFSSAKPAAEKRAGGK